jgi:hypothetical protein
MPTNGMTTEQITEAGQRIYASRYQKEFEKAYPNQFAVIDVTTEMAYVASTADEALKKAETASPEGKYFLIRVGSAGAFKVSYALHVRGEGIFRSSRQSDIQDQNWTARGIVVGI